MSKDTREFIHNKGGASLWDGVELQRDKMNVNAIAYTQAADLEGTIVRFYPEQREIENTISHYQETDESISEDDTVALTKRIRDLHLRYPFDGHAHYIAFLTGQCLKLKEGQTAGEVFTATVMLKAKNLPPAFPEWRGPMLKRIITLAVPAELNATFGVESFSWLQSRSEDCARDYARKGCTHGSPARRLFDFGIVDTSSPKGQVSTKSGQLQRRDSGEASGAGANPAPWRWLVPTLAREPGGSGTRYTGG